MNGYAPAVLAVLLGGLLIGAPTISGLDLVNDVLVGVQLGVLVGSAVLMVRAVRGSNGRSAEILAAWTLVGAVVGALAHLGFGG